MIIGAPQPGQVNWARGRLTSRRLGSRPKSHCNRRMARWLLGCRKPKLRVRRNPFGNTNRNGVKSWIWQPLADEDAQLVRQPDAKLRLALGAWPQFGGGCG